MDVLINIIIVMVVIATVLKRIQEVAQKGTEVKKSSAPLPGGQNVAPLAPAADDDHRTQDTAKSPATIEKAEPELRSMKDLFEYFQQEFQDGATTQEQPESTPAAVMAESEAVPVITEAVSASAQVPAMRSEPVNRKSYRAVSPSLTFSPGQVVNGIILSEVLGPPVALRDQSGPGRR